MTEHPPEYAVTPDNRPFVDLVQICAEGSFGTGLLLGRGLVLTALHVVCDPEAGWRFRSGLGIYLLRELWQGREDPLDAQLVWPRAEVSGERPPDVAVLQIKGADPPKALTQVKFGELPRVPTMGSARGFPRLARGPLLPGGRTEHDQPGRVTYTSWARRALTIDAVGRHDMEGWERWAGLSGGPLFAKGLIVGVMREVPDGWKGEAVEAEPLAPLLRGDDCLRERLGVRLPLEDRSDPALEQQPALDLTLPPAPAEDNAYRFAFIARKTRFVDREALLAELEEFAGGAEPFRWWSVGGEAGVGKSRLALEAMLKLDSTWRAGFLPRDEDQGFRWHEWRPLYPTFITVDYASLRIPKVREMVGAIDMAAKAGNLDWPVRVLLLDRAPDVTQLPGWGQAVMAAHLQPHRFKEPLVLGGLGEECAFR
jgi:hypothetical protein